MSGGNDRPNESFNESTMYHDYVVILMEFTNIKFKDG